MKYLKPSKCLTAAGIMLLLTGCARETDLSARFPDYLQYSLGADYKTELLTDGGGKNPDKWQFTYHDHTGAERKTQGFSVSPYDRRSKSFKDWTEEEYYSLRVLQLASWEIADIAYTEVTEEIFKPHFPEFNGKNCEDGNLGSAKLSIVPMTAIDFAMDTDKDDYAILQTCIAPGTGWQICTADWKTVANSADWYYFVSVDAEEGADAAKYTAQMQDALRDFKEQAGAAQNYTFFVRQMKDGKPVTVWQENAVLGKLTEGDRFTFEVADALREKINGKE